MRENEGSSAPFRAPCSSALFFPSTPLARISPECLVLSSPSSRRGFSSLSAAAAPFSSFCPVGCRGAAKTRKERERNWSASLISVSPPLSYSFLLLPLNVLAFFFSPWLPRRVGLWMLSLSYLMPSTLRRQWRYQHIHSFQILPHPLFREMSHPKRRNEHTNEVADAKRKGKNAGISWILLSLRTNSPGCCTNQILIVYEIWNACLRPIFFNAPFYNTFSYLTKYGCNFLFYASEFASLSDLIYDTRDDYKNKL